MIVLTKEKQERHREEVAWALVSLVCAATLRCRQPPMITKVANRRCSALETELFALFLNRIVHFQLDGYDLP